MRILNAKLPDPVDGSGELQDPHLEQSLHDEPEDSSDDILADDNNNNIPRTPAEEEQNNNQDQHLDHLQLRIV